MRTLAEYFQDMIQQEQIKDCKERIEALRRSL